MEKYCTTVYGSNLWDLGSLESCMMVNAWHTGHKLAWDVPRGCRSYLVQEVLAPHVKSLQANLFLCEICFFRALLDSPSHKVTVVTLLAARDLRSNLASRIKPAEGSPAGSTQSCSSPPGQMEGTMSAGTAGCPPPSLLHWGGG